jgi:hypothetical protein
LAAVLRVGRRRCVSQGHVACGGIIFLFSLYPAYAFASLDGDLVGYIVPSIILGLVMIGAGMTEVRAPRLKPRHESYWH